MKSIPPRPLGLLIVILALACAVRPAGAQVTRLPAIDIEEAAPPGQLLSYPAPPSDLFQAPGQPSVPAEPEVPRGVRSGVFQKLTFDGTWLAPGGHEGFGVSDLELRTVLGFPCPTRESPLVVTPGFAVHYFDGPTSPDVPPRVYDAYAQFRWLSRLTPRLGVDLSITPGVFSDFQQSSDKAVRINNGYGVGAWTWNPATKVVLGAGYFDRHDTRVLPVGGIMWNPNDDTSFDLLFPAPKIARRVYWCGSGTADVQDWIYLSGEFGGSTWAVQRASGADDVLYYRDIRIILGLERKVIGGFGGRMEVGYVFRRRLQYASPTPEFDPSDTVLLRGGLVY